MSIEPKLLTRHCLKASGGNFQEEMDTKLLVVITILEHSLLLLVLDSKNLWCNDLKFLNSEPERPVV